MVWVIFYGLQRITRAKEVPEKALLEGEAQSEAGHPIGVANQ